MNFDYHMHTLLSDGGHSHEEMIMSAIEKGFDEIGFSDHFCIKYRVKWAVSKDEIAILEKKVTEVKEQYKDQISILFGLEVDYFPELEDEIRDALKGHNFDYVIGSIHFLNDWNYDTDKSRNSEFSSDYLYDWYFGELQKAVKSKLFDYMAHPDLIKKHRIWPEHSKTALFRETAEIFSSAGIAFEVNTSGLDRPCGEFFPGKELLAEFYKAGVQVTLGSDSHQSIQIGRYFDQAKQLLKEIGYKSVIRFKQRTKIIENLD